MNEFDLIKNYFSTLTNNNKGSFTLNDDVFFDKSKKLVVSVDTYIEGLHFYDFKKPELVIKKIIRSSISDLICKGVRPKYYFISGSGNKRSFSAFNLKKISKSLKQEQDKYNMYLCGGDTVFSNKLSFSITSIGFSNEIVLRNKAKLNDDIYVTGNLGDSYTGLRILKRKVNPKNNDDVYFVKKYFLPEVQITLAPKLFKFANTSIDISDGLIADLEKLINKQKLSYKLNIDDVPISNYLKKYLASGKLSKLTFVSKGDDYQVLFTASPIHSRIIEQISRSLNIKISKIGKICPPTKKSLIVDKKGNKIAIKHKGYSHQF